MGDLITTPRTNAPCPSSYFISTVERHSRVRANGKQLYASTAAISAPAISDVSRSASPALHAGESFATLYLGAPFARRIKRNFAAVHLVLQLAVVNQDSLALFSDGLELLVQVIFVEV